MPFPYELYPKAKETHCLNLPEISVSRPPFPGSIRTVDGCFWGWRDNNSYADTTITASDGTSYKYGTVFTEKTTKGEGIACSSYANCYIGCSCNTSNGWYSTCQGSDCKSATDNHYTGVNSLSAGKSISDVASISASGANSGISASATATSGISTMASGATTCYKKKTCSEGGYYDSVPADQKCSSKSYNGYSCYTGCSYKTCSDYGYNSSIPSGKTCTAVYPRSGLTCYKDCKDEIKYYSVTINKVFDSSCPTNFAAGFNGISSCNVGSVNCSTYENSITVSNVAEGTSYSWTPTDSYSTTETTATYSGGTKSGTVNSNLTLTATYNCSSGSTQEPKCTCWPNCWYYVTTYGRNKYIVCNIECTYNGGPTMEICVDIDNSLGNTMCGGVGFITYKYVGPVTDNITSSGLGESISIYDWSPKTDNCMPNANIGGGGVGPIGYPNDLN